MANKRRIQRDIKELEERAPPGIYYQINSDDLMDIFLLIQCLDSESPYYHCFFQIRIMITERYPHMPPKVGYKGVSSARIHPNLYAPGLDELGGKVCLSILGTYFGEPWSPLMTLTTIALQIQALLQPNPLSCEPGFGGKITRNHRDYELVKQYEAMRDMISILKNPDLAVTPKFYEIIREYYTKNHSIICEYLNELRDKYNDQVIQRIIHCKQTKLNYAQLIGELQEVST